jgi:hypothetical protein
MANAWLTLVKKTWDEGRKTDKEYSYKQAMMDAKMKKHGPKKGGQVEVEESVEETPSGNTIVEEEATFSTSTPTMGGKSRRSKKSKKGGKTSKKSKKAGKKSKKTRKARK